MRRKTNAKQPPPFHNFAPPRRSINFKQLIFATPLPKYFAFYRSGAGRRIFINVGKCHPNRPRRTQIMLLLFSQNVSAGGLKRQRAIYVLFELSLSIFAHFVAFFSDLSADMFYKFKVQTLPCYHSPGGIQPGLDQPSRSLSCSRARG